MKLLKDKYIRIMLLGFFGIIIVLAIGLNREYSFINLATFGLCILTAIYAFATIMLVLENQKTLKEMQQSRLDSVKPALSLQPEGFSFGGGFSSLYLVNSGGVAKKVNIDVEVRDPHSKKLYYVPAIDKEHKVYLEIAGEVQKKGSVIIVSVSYYDNYDQKKNETYQIDFSELLKEGRKIWGQHSDVDSVLRELQNIAKNIEKIKFVTRER